MEFKKIIENLNALLGVEAVFFIQEMILVFKEKGCNISLEDAIINTQKYQYLEEHNKYKFYQLVQSVFNENIVLQKSMQRYLNIREHSSKTYTKEDTSFEADTLYGDETLKIVDEISSTIINKFELEKASQECSNFLLYGEPGIGKTQILKNVIAKVIKRIDIEYIEIRNIDIETTNDVQSLSNKILSLISQNKKIIIFIDEIDGIIQKRDPKNGNHSNKKIVNDLIQLIDSNKNKKISIMATTNFYDSLDEAFVRSGRFKAYKLWYPDYNERYNIAHNILLENKEAFKYVFTNEVVQENKNKGFFVRKAVKGSVCMVELFGGLQKEKKDLLELYALFLSIFTVKQTQADIIMQTKTLISCSAEYIKKEKGGAIEVISDTVDKIYRNFFRKNNKTNKPLMNYIHHFLQRYLEDRNSIDKLKEELRQTAEKEDIRFPQHIISKNDFEISAKEIVLNASVYTEPRWNV